MIDSIRITVSGGRGGRGAVAFRREKFVPRGGPAGGDGGDGGSIVLRADSGLSTLDAFRYKRIFKAAAGGQGGGARKHGRDGATIELAAPVGTQVWDVTGARETTREEAGTLLADLTTHRETVVLAAGGHGGRGNVRFVSSTRREPLLAEDGDEGEHRVLRLDLKLMADVGLVGMPNAGKSTLIAAISRARPKIAGYPFTTLEPVLGVVELRRKTLVVVEIPGLVAGAHSGTGLGHEFLRHVERTRLLVHLVDGSEASPEQRMQAVNAELRLFDERLALIPQLVAVNKLDIPEVVERRAELEKRIQAEISPETKVHFVSAAARTGLDSLLAAMFRGIARVDRERSERSSSDEVQVAAPAVLRPVADRPQVVAAVREDDAFRVTHPRAVRLARGSDLTGWKARLQMHEQLQKLGIARTLEKLGVSSGDRVRIGEWEFTWE